MTAHLLVVEDSAVQAEMLQQDLVAAGYEVTFAPDGQEALAWLEDGGRPDAVITDVMMPGINGYDLCREIKRTRSLEGVPVILLTTLKDPVDIVRGLECGADNFVTKPYEPDSLLHRLDTVLRSNDRRLAGRFRMGVEVLVLGHTFTVSADRQQILDMLMSSFEELVNTNDRLREREEQLEATQTELRAQVALAEQRGRELERSRDDLRNLLEQTQVTTWRVDLDTTEMRWSPNATEVFGLAPDTPLDTVESFFAVVMEEDTPLLREITEGLRCDEGLPEEWSFRIVGTDGRTRCFSVRGHAVTTADGVIHVSGLAMDVTRRRELETELARARDEAEAANRAKSDYLSRMSHELRTPMNSVLGFAQLLELSDLAGPDRDSVERIRRAGRHLLQLIDDVLDIARIEAGHLQISLEPVDVAGVVDRAIDLLRPQLDDRDLELVVEVDPSCRVVADNQRLGQVLINLVSNAIKYNRHGGRVSVTCDRPVAGWCRLAVTDTGPGIAAEVRPRLFQTFDRLGADQTEVSGTGLGLALSKTLVEAMHGEIGCDSELGVGSTFWVDLPEAGADGTVGSHAVIDDAADDQRPTSQASLLYVEDNPLNVELVERALAHRPGIRLRHAGSGDEGLQLAREERPGLVLLDLQLPGMSGRDLLGHLRADPDLSAVPVVVVSADATKVTAQALQDGGADGYLTKPLDLAELHRTIDDLLCKNQPSHATAGPSHDTTEG